jgi:hypothetical protein
VNANPEANSVDVSNFASLRRAIPGDSAQFHPLEMDPLSGQWNAAAVPAATIALPAFSQTILIDPQNCPNCVSVAGDYNGDGLVGQADFDLWRAKFESADAGADGNGDGVVDAADYVVWRNAAGNDERLIASAMITATLVPEPTAVWLVLSSVVLACMPRPAR